MTEDERHAKDLDKLEKTLRDFRIVTSGLDGQFEYKLDKPEKANQSLTNAERIAALQKIHDEFRIIGGANVRIEGSMKTGFCVNNTCEGAGAAGFPEQIPGGGITPDPTGACCVGTDCTIQTESDCTGMGGTYQGDNTDCDPNPCTATCSGITHISVAFTFDADDGQFFFSGSGTVECDLNESCNASCTELFDVTVHNHLGEDCAPDPHVSCAVILTYLGVGSWQVDTQAIMLDHSTVCDGTGWPPNSISASSSDTFSGTTFSTDLTPDTPIVMNGHIDVTLS